MYGSTVNRARDVTRKRHNARAADKCKAAARYGPKLAPTRRLALSLHKSLFYLANLAFPKYGYTN